MKVLFKIRDILFEALTCSPELIVMCQMLTGLFTDASDEQEQFPLESEKNYCAALICLIQVYGDPRGRGNYTSPYALLFSWKLSQLALAESRKLADSEFAEEIFDASLSSLYNHRRKYKS